MQKSRMMRESRAENTLKGEIKMDKNYKNYISLGYFCEVAQDLEKLGLRNASSPFDWGISYFPNVIDAIDKEFDGFLDYDNLSQNALNRAHYHEDKYHFYFFHDFDKYKSLDKQYASVKEKYWKRIKRFLNSIKDPSLFVKYISIEELDENGKSIELTWIENNRQHILDVLRRYNSENDIVYIGDETVNSDIIKIYHVPCDEGDRVSRLPIYNNNELFSILSGVHFPGKEENQHRYELKEKKKHSYITSLKNKTVHFLQRMFFKEYEYSKVYYIADK